MNTTSYKSLLHCSTSTLIELNCLFPGQKPATFRKSSRIASSIDTKSRSTNNPSTVAQALYYAHALIAHISTKSPTSSQKACGSLNYVRLLTAKILGAFFVLEPHQVLENRKKTIPLTQESNTAMQKMTSTDKTLRPGLPVSSIATAIAVTLFSTSALAVNVEVSGEVEVESSLSTLYDKSHESAISLAEVELAFSIRPNNTTAIDVVMLHEDHETEEQVVDSATITYTELPLNGTFIGGRQYIPFGLYESHMISDPLTANLGETRQNALYYRTELASFEFGIGVYKGTLFKEKESNTLPDYLVNLGFNQEFSSGSLLIAASYNSNVANSKTTSGNTLHPALTHIDKSVPAFAASVNLKVAKTQFLAECIQATAAFDASNIAFKGNGAKPSACQFEFSLDGNLFKKETSYSLGYQSTQQMLEFFGLPAERLMFGFSLQADSNTTLRFEWAQDTDYGTDVSADATGLTMSTVTAQVAVSF